MLPTYAKSFGDRKFLMIMLALVFTLIVDISVVKVYDLVSKFFIPIQYKLTLFSVNTSICTFLQFLLIWYIKGSFDQDSLNTNKIKVRVFYIASVCSIVIASALLGGLIYQLLSGEYYDKRLSISLIGLSYATSTGFIVSLSVLFLSWFRSNHSIIVFLYFVSMLGIAFNLIMTGAFMGVSLGDRPTMIGQYVGATGDISAGRHDALDYTYRISTFVSFFGIWLTTTILVNYYRERTINSIVYWTILCIPLAYFLITYFYRFIFSDILITYLQIDPVAVSIALSAFLSSSKPLGGLIFGLVFWKISRTIRYERNVRTYMVISGWGLFLIFAANQAALQTVAPYPPFGVGTITALNIAGFFMLIGIYNSAILVSSNNELRKSIHRHAMESKLLGMIGQAEMEMEIQKTVKRIAQDKNLFEKDLEQPVELDENELKKYLDFVAREVKKSKQVTDS